MPAEAVRRIAIEAATGLVAAHAAGLIHRDLKPENIFLTRSGRTKLLDFGIAKLVQPEDSTDRVSTLTGIVLGTSGYLAPEQIRGKAIDARADLFALGAVLFEMLTGARAFAREHIVETLHAILHDPPPDLLADIEQVPPALADIVYRLLDKAPEARCQSAADLIAALEAVDLRPGSSPRQAVRAPQPPAGVTDVTLAVMPIRSIPAGSDSELFGLGLADVSISRLGQIADLRVLPLTATERMRAEDPLAAARRLQANRVLIVTLQRDSGLVRASVQLLSVGDERTLWSTTVDTDASSVFSIQDIIVTRVIEELAPHVRPDARRRLARPGTRSAAAHEACLRGRVHVMRPTPADLKSAVESFQAALALGRVTTPMRGPAWRRPTNGCPRSSGHQSEDFARARDAASRRWRSSPGTQRRYRSWAPSPSGTSGTTPAPNGSCARPSLFSRTPPMRRSSWRTSSPTRAGTTRHSRRSGGRGRSIPAWPVPRALEGQFLCCARRYEHALAHLNGVIEVAPTLWTGHLFRVYTLIGLGRYDDAVQGCDRVVDLRRALDSAEPGPYALVVALKGYALARLGRSADAEAQLAMVAGAARPAARGPPMPRPSCCTRSVATTNPSPGCTRRSTTVTSW